ncbi:MAG: DUF4288 domain-containing protein [Planctomycetota bacterium]|jgi:hypothetical protein
MGWFAAKVRFRAVRAGRAKDDLYEDSVFVFRSRSAPVARRRAESIAEAMVLERVETDEKGRKVRWVLDLVHDVVEVGSEGLVDGAEIWRDRLVRRKATG